MRVFKCKRVIVVGCYLNVMMASLSSTVVTCASSFFRRLTKLGIIHSHRIKILYFFCTTDHFVEVIDPLSHQVLQDHFLNFVYREDVYLAREVWIVCTKSLVELLHFYSQV